MTAAAAAVNVPGPENQPIPGAGPGIQDLVAHRTGKPSRFFAALQDRDKAIREIDQLRQQRDEARDANAQLATLLQAAYTDIADLRAALNGATL